jgi:hypothetical protein
MMAHKFLVQQQDGGVIGPVNVDTLRDLFASGHIPKDAFVSKDRSAFVPIVELPELQEVLAKARAAKTQVPSYSGFFSDHSFSRVFYRLHLAKETGRMLVSRGDERKEIFMVSGLPVFVGSNLPDERIGEYLVTHGALSRQQLEDALVIVGNYGNHLGNTLMGMKIITPHSFYEHLVGQLRLKLMKLIPYGDGRYDFFKDVMYDGPKLPIDLDPLEILTEGTRLFIDKSLAMIRLGARIDKPLLHAKKAPVTAHRLGLDGFEIRVFEQMNDMRTPRDLSVEFPGMDDGKTALALALFMLDIGLVETA